MKKIILLTLAALMMVGCSTEPSHCHSIYFGDKWDILKMNDSTYLMIPKYEEYYEPCTLKIKTKATAVSVRSVGRRNWKSLLNN